MPSNGNNWLSSALPVILNSAVYRSGSTIIFITWDEGEGGGYASGEHCATNTSDVSKLRVRMTSPRARLLFLP